MVETEITRLESTLCAPEIGKRAGLLEAFQHRSRMWSVEERVAYAKFSDGDPGQSNLGVYRACDEKGVGRYFVIRDHLLADGKREFEVITDFSFKKHVTKFSAKERKLLRRPVVTPS